jgi:hypothetical protein
VDLVSPLIAVTLVADAERAGDRTAHLLALARELGGLRDAEADEGPTSRLVAALDRIRQEHGPEVAPDALLRALRALPGWRGVGTTRRLAALLIPLGFHRLERRHGAPRYIYRLDREQLDDLRARYGGPAAADGEP